MNEHDEDSEERDPVWVTAAEQMLARLIEGIEIDEAEGIVRLPSSDDEGYPEEFTDLDALVLRLEALGEDEMYVNSPYEGGEPVFGNMDASGIVQSLLPASIEKFFETLRSADSDEGPVLFRSSELIAPGRGMEVDVVFRDVNAELIQ